jgi:hypothetical protein
MQPLAMFACWQSRTNNSPLPMDDIGLVAICLVVLAVIGAAWLHFGR